jgi:uncharacterized membrane protein
MEQVKVDGHVRHFSWKWLVYLAAGLILAGWLLSTPNGILGKADAIAYAVCHRIDTRSFHLGTRQLPLCARCTGMYLGAVLGLVYQAILRPHRSGAPHWVAIALSSLFIVAFGIDGLNSYLHFFPNAPSLYEPQNWLRLLTGTGMGLVISVAIFPAFNQIIWVDWDQRASIDSALMIGWLVLLAGGLDLLVLTNNIYILFLLALISSAGVLILLTMIYTMVLVMIFRQENHFQKITQMLLHLTGGATLALLQIALFDFIRFVLTVTWDGFHLG